MSKADYVLRQKQTRGHTCHWPGCGKECPPAMWGCRQHWFALPKCLRNRIWATYKPGQEITMTPSEAYLKAADDVQRWIKENEKSKQLGREADREMFGDEPERFGLENIGNK